ncbi:GntR family transcriptional regulator [Shewanella marina]|uniref:GntR family transcriptional regulator n=1 Tax=Shewanella marina TaxID=487319 RepID=UPI00046ED169|nr:GntR family transcriptional regulator [Shewanella marina]
MNRITPIIHKTRTQVVVEVLREKILSGDIAAGEPLRQTALAEELNVSRIPIREALLQLEAEGLVKFEAHKGATATELSVNHVNELFNLRALIETDLLAKSIPNMTEFDLHNAESLLLQLEDAFKRRESIASWSELNMAFHLCLYRPAQCPHTLDIVQNLNNNCDRYIRLQLVLEGSIPQAAKEHRLLLEYCKQRDVTEATQLLKSHIIDAAQAIGNLVKTKNNNSVLNKL